VSVNKYEVRGAAVGEHDFTKYDMFLD